MQNFICQFIEISLRISGLFRYALLYIYHFIETAYSITPLISMIFWSGYL